MTKALVRRLDSTASHGMIVTLAVACVFWRWPESGAWLPVSLLPLSWLCLRIVGRLSPIPAMGVALLGGGATTAIGWLSAPSESQAATLPLALAAVGASLLGLLLSFCSPGWSGRPFLFASCLLGALLAYASTDAGGPDGMVLWLQEVFGWTQQAAETATVVFRKCVHFTYFGLIAWTAYRGVRNEVSPSQRAIGSALAWTASFAAFDELSQLASPARTGSALDFLLDMAGAGAFVWLASRSSGTTQARRSA